MTRLYLLNAIFILENQITSKINNVATQIRLPEIVNSGDLFFILVINVVII